MHTQSTTMASRDDDDVSPNDETSLQYRMIMNLKIKKQLDLNRLNGLNKL